MSFGRPPCKTQTCPCLNQTQKTEYHMSVCCTGNEMPADATIFEKSQMITPAQKQMLESLRRKTSLGNNGYQNELSLAKCISSKWILLFFSEIHWNWKIPNFQYRQSKKLSHDPECPFFFMPQQSRRRYYHTTHRGVHGIGTLIVQWYNFVP